MSEKSDRSRVQTLLDEGRITADEAEILFAALDEADAQPVAEDEPVAEDDEPEAEDTASAARMTPKQLRDEARAKAHETAERAREKAREARVYRREAADRVQEKMREDRARDKKSLKIPAINIPAINVPIPAINIPAVEVPFGSMRPPAPPTAPTTPAEGGYTYAAGARRVKISGFCGDLDVVGDPNISEPVVVGNATVSWDGGSCTIRTPNKDQEGSRNWLNRLHRAAGDLKVQLPADMSVELAVAAGDGSVRGATDVRGNFTGGDFYLEGAERLDLTVTAGDVSVRLRPTEGRQRLRATSGDIDLVLLPGSSVSVSGRATCGDLTLPPGFSRDGSFGTQRFSGTVGAGAAELELRLTAGDVDVRADVKMESA